MDFSTNILLSLRAGVLSSCFAVSAVVAAPIEKFSIVKTENGFVRTNVETGHTSICNMSVNQLICRASIDEIRAFEESNQQLSDQITELEQKILEIEKSTKKGLDLRGSEEFDKAMDMMEGILTRFFDMAKNLNDDDGN